MMKQKIWRLVRPMVRSVVGKMIIALFYLLRAFPIQKNKVVASAFIGRRYGDNQKYMMEELHKLCPEADIVWVKDSRFGYELPEWIRPVRYRSFRWLYDYATAKIWTDNCTLPEYFVKRKGQLYVETWHGGLGIKKVAMDESGEVSKIRNDKRYLKGTDMADVYISNSDPLSKI